MFWTVSRRPIQMKLKDYNFCAKKLQKILNRYRNEKRVKQLFTVIVGCEWNGNSSINCFNYRCGKKDKIWNITESVSLLAFHLRANYTKTTIMNNPRKDGNNEIIQHALPYENGAVAILRAFRWVERSNGRGRLWVLLVDRVARAKKKKDTSN